ncbi:hypothetical protein ACFSQ7_14145 [Paenibacillus rhizoplanae]
MFTAPKDERLDTPERSTLINKAIHGVYNLEYVVNPASMTGEAGISNTENNQGDEARVATTDEKLISDVMLSADGNVGLFQIHFTVQDDSLPQSAKDSVVTTIRAAQQK